MYGGLLQELCLLIPLGFINYNTPHLETINAMVALETWGHCWSNKCVQFFCDNIDVVEILFIGPRMPFWLPVPAIFGY